MGDEEENKGKINEPSVSYSGNNIRVYTSFDDAAKGELADILKQSPEDRIRETVQLILRVYGVTQEELNERTRNMKITIIRS